MKLIPNSGAPKGVSAALIGVFAGFAEVIVERLNKVPHKNFLAFLDLLGAAPQPPRSARVALTFLPARGSRQHALVPAGTRVAAPPGSGEKEPVVFETERELVVTAARVALGVMRDPEDDAYGVNHADESKTSFTSQTSLFQADQRMAHVLYLGQSQYLDAPGLEKLGLSFELQTAATDERRLSWQIWDGDAWREIVPSDDGTGSLSRSGIRIVQFDWGVRKFPRARPAVIGGITMNWIRCCLLTPVTRSSAPRKDMVRVDQLPKISVVKMDIVLGAKDLPIGQAFSSASRVIDLSRPFYPFGEKPKFNDTLWLASEEAFSNTGATVTLDITATTEPSQEDQKRTPLPANPSDDLELVWEAWNGAWVALGASTKKGGPGSGTFSDSTNAFSQSGEVVFTVPQGVARCSVNGKESFWIRVRIAKGDYGEEGHFEPEKQDGKGDKPPYKFVPPNFRRPSINSLKAKYTLQKTASSGSPVLPEKVLAENNSVIADLTERNGVAGETFAPFQPSQDERPTFYLGFLPPATDTAFQNSPITIFFHIVEPHDVPETLPGAPDSSRRRGGVTHSDEDPAQHVRLTWEYWSGGEWTRLVVRDETSRFTVTGTVEFLAPPDFAPRVEYGTKAWWLRVRWESGEVKTRPRVDRILLNTTMAAQTVTIRNEILGSSDGGANQKFRTAQAPVLEGQKLEVREPEAPAGDEVAECSPGRQGQRGKPVGDLGHLARGDGFLRLALPIASLHARSHHGRNCLRRWRERDGPPGWIGKHPPRALPNRRRRPRQQGGRRHRAAQDDDPVRRQGDKPFRRRRRGRRRSRWTPSSPARRGNSVIAGGR